MSEGGRESEKQMSLVYAYRCLNVRHSCWVYCRDLNHSHQSRSIVHAVHCCLLLHNVQMRSVMLILTPRDSLE